MKIIFCLLETKIGESQSADINTDVGTAEATSKQGEAEEISDGHHGNEKMEVDHTNTSGDQDSKSEQPCEEGLGELQVMNETLEEGEIKEQVYRGFGVVRISH